MATYGGGTQVNAAVSNSVSTGTLYTAPADGYAIVNLHVTTGATDLAVGGRAIYDAAPTGTNLFGVMVGPSQAVTISGSSKSVQISGVEFKNNS